MAEQTKIEWTDATWNPITGCTLVDDGCRNCYAAELAATRLKTHPSRAGLARKNASGVAKFTGEVRFNDQWLAQPLGWRKPRMVFVCAHGDLFHESVPDQWIDQVFAVMALARRHTFQVLTKRPDRAREYLSHLQARIYWNDIAVKARAAGITLLGDMSYLRQHELGPLPNVWLGTSISDQASADARVPELLATPTAIRFLSAEPLLGPVDLRLWIGTAPIIPGASTYRAEDGFDRQDIGGGLVDGLDWIIVGGESGRNARPMHPDWARSLRDQCQAAGVAFFFKQAGAWTAWEFASPPYLRNAFTGEEQDRHALLPDRETFDCGRDWDDGLDFVPESSHAVFQRIGKKAAGRLLDGREWSEVPG